MIQGFGHQGAEVSGGRGDGACQAVTGQEVAAKGGHGALEEMRLFYVGATRSASRLMIGPLGIVEAKGAWQVSAREMHAQRAAWLKEKK